MLISDPSNVIEACAKTAYGFIMSGNTKFIDQNNELVYKICAAIRNLKEAAALHKPAEPEGMVYSDEVRSLADFRRWLMNRQQPPHAGTDTICWLNPKQVLEKFDLATRALRASPSTREEVVEECALKAIEIGRIYRDNFHGNKDAECVALFKFAEILRALAPQKG